MTDWLNNNSGGTGNPGVAFTQVGHKVIGLITMEPKPVTTDFGERMVVELRALAGCTALKGAKGADGVIKEGDEVTLWIKPGRMAGAVADAIRAEKAAGLSEGDTIALAFTDTLDTGKVEPVKIYAAQIRVAKPVAAVSEFESLI